MAVNAEIVYVCTYHSEMCMSQSSRAYHDIMQLIFNSSSIQASEHLLLSETLLHYREVLKNLPLTFFCFCFCYVGLRHSFPPLMCKSGT